MESGVDLGSKGVAVAAGGGEAPVLQNPAAGVAVECGIAAGGGDFYSSGGAICRYRNAYSHYALYPALPQQGRVAGLRAIPVGGRGVGFRGGA